MRRFIFALLPLLALTGCGGNGDLSEQRPLQAALDRLHAQPYASRYAFQTTTPAGGPLPARAVKLLSSAVEETQLRESPTRLEITELSPKRVELLFYDGDAYARTGSGPLRRVAPRTAARYRLFYLSSPTPGRDCAVTRVADYTGPGGRRQLRYRVRVTGSCLHELFSRIFAGAGAGRSRVTLGRVTLDYFVDAQSRLPAASSGRISGNLEPGDGGKAVPFMRVSRQGYFPQPVHLRRPSG